MSSSLPEIGFLAWMVTPKPYVRCFTAGERNITLFLYFYSKRLVKAQANLAGIKSALDQKVGVPSAHQDVRAYPHLQRPPPEKGESTGAGQSPTTGSC